MTTEPAPITFTFEGNKQLAVDLAIFEISVACYPLRKGDRLLVYPLISTAAGQRWAAVEKLNGGLAMATMQSDSSLKIDGVEAVYGADKILIPYGATYQAGYRVAVAPTWDGSAIKYVVINRYS